MSSSAFGLKTKRAQCACVQSEALRREGPPQRKTTDFPRAFAKPQTHPLTCRLFLQRLRVFLSDGSSKALPKKLPKNREKFLQKRRF
jgi:hypothetical protein